MSTQAAAIQGRADILGQEWYRQMRLRSRARLPNVKIWKCDQVEQFRYERLAADAREVWPDPAYSTDLQTNAGR